MKKCLSKETENIKQNQREIIEMKHNNQNKNVREYGGNGACSERQERTLEKDSVKQ